MILERTPLNMNEVELINKDLVESDKKQEIELFLKKFLKTKNDKAKKIKEELEKLDLLKIKREHIVKIVDFLPPMSVGLFGYSSPLHPFHYPHHWNGRLDSQYRHLRP